MRYSIINYIASYTLISFVFMVNLNYLIFYFIAYLLTIRILKYFVFFLFLSPVSIDCIILLTVCDCYTVLYNLRSFKIFIFIVNIYLFSK